MKCVITFSALVKNLVVILEFQQYTNKLNKLNKHFCQILYINVRVGNIMMKTLL